MLSTLVSEFSAKIIIHSGWKHWFDHDMDPLRPEAENLKNMLLQCGIKICDKTPDLASDEIKATHKFSLIKAEEILGWLSKHPDNKWIVIDDLDLHNEVVRKH